MHSDKQLKKLIFYTDMKQRKGLVLYMINERDNSCVFFADTSVFVMMLLIADLLDAVFKSDYFPAEKFQVAILSVFVRISFL